MSRQVTVIPGEVLTDSVTVVARRPGLLAVVIATRTKYPDTATSYGDGSSPSVYLTAPEYALHVSEDPELKDRATRIDFPAYTSGWRIVCDGSGRYEIMAVAYRDGWRWRHRSFLGRRIPLRDLWVSPVDHYGEPPATCDNTPSG